MSIADAFTQFLANLEVDNAATISSRYEEITCSLNKKFRDTESKIANSLQVGSYGRRTAIKGISDLDMLYIIPTGEWDTYGSFKYPDTYNGGSWKITKPREEIQAMKEFDFQKNKNLRRLCKMARAWKNKHGVGMGGLLIDTLAHNFLKSTTEYEDKSYFYYDFMSRDFFAYLKDLPKQDYYAALGSGQRVNVKKSFQRRAKKAHELCLKAIDAEGKNNQNDKWRAVYGRLFPASEKLMIVEAAPDRAVRMTEEFADNVFAGIDIRNNIKIDCNVEQAGFRTASLREILKERRLLKPKKTLKFSVVNTDIVGPYGLFWKVLNRGQEAVKRDCIRGQIVADDGHKSRTETTTFRGDHVVECYAVVDTVVVATDRIHVPIDSNQEDDDG
ncbi:nucleotide-binding domain-containing protein [Parasphingorhabdus sp.]|uniref:nucleotide-binding domain-containing protein n=1 Tax=Parasphingorhabdus sp. TaxID=2709688 RepID=UPI002F922C89